MEKLDVVKIKSSAHRKEKSNPQSQKKMILSLKKEGLSIQIFNDIDLDQLSILLNVGVNDGR
ncbi:hypothetical protein ACTQ54_02320 [Fundicoccus sp. Sow4_H7]|uniref:hypothetical protein n=1 Tax=Fundicoccus sp. Sow4_H7 TaxID=3438784 RepID=UPI003F8DC18C